MKTGHSPFGDNWRYAAALDEHLDPKSIQNYLDKAETEKNHFLSRMALHAVARESRESKRCMPSFTADVRLEDGL